MKIPTKSADGCKSSNTKVMTNISVELYFPILDPYLSKELLHNFGVEIPIFYLIKAYLYTGRGHGKRRTRNT